MKRKSFDVKVRSVLEIYIYINTTSHT